MSSHNYDRDRARQRPTFYRPDSETSIPLTEQPPMSYNRYPPSYDRHNPPGFPPGLGARPPHSQRRSVNSFELQRQQQQQQQSQQTPPPMYSSPYDPQRTPIYAAQHTNYPQNPNYPYGAQQQQPSSPQTQPTNPFVAQQSSPTSRSRYRQSQQQQQHSQQNQQRSSNNRRNSPDEAPSSPWNNKSLLAPFRSNVYNEPDRRAEYDISYNNSGATSTTSLTQYNSARPSFADDHNNNNHGRNGSFAEGDDGFLYLDTATGHPVWGQDYSRAQQNDSRPGTPGQHPNDPYLPPPTPTWMYNSRSASPVASSLYLPGQGMGGASSPGGASMSSLGSAPYRSQRDLIHLFPDAPSEIWDREWVKEGYIAKIHKRDDKDEWPNWKRYLFFTVPFLAIATLGTYWLYFILRIVFIRDAQRLQGKSFPLAWVFVGIEISVAVPTFLQMFWMVFILKGRKRPKLRLVGNDVPTVDVFITCCGEDVDLVLDTARAACDLDYPQDRFRVVILDDANSAALREGIEDMNGIYPNVCYRSRPKFPGVPHHFKAGNLNYGLEVVNEMPGGASKYMAALDADMIPEQHWLRAIMPHMLEDENLALACPPQLFYNVPPGDPLCQSLDFFVNVSEPIKDALGVAWCTGSGYIIRRDALEQIGCFPQGSLAEDVCTSTLLLGAGWKCAFIHEPLQFGTVPEDFGSHLKQRTRWAIGTVETSVRLKFCLWGDQIKKLTFYQRMSSIIYAILSLYNIFLTISLFALPVVLLSGNALVAYANTDQLRWLIRACFLALFVNRICELAMFLPSGYATGQRGARSQIWMAPYITLSILRSFVLPSWFGGQKQAFKPTGSLKSELNERDPARRAGVWRRFSVIAINYMAAYHLFYVYLVLAAVTLTTLRCVFSNPDAEDKLVCLLTHAFWPPIAWVITLSAFWTPISYALNPPSVPDREELLKRDPKTDIAHPTKKSKKIAWKAQTAIFEFEYFISTAFTVAVFVATFIVGIA